MHRDISQGNILIVSRMVDGVCEVSGMLADWELSKEILGPDEGPTDARQPERTVSETKHQTYFKLTSDS